MAWMPLLARFGRDLEFVYEKFKFISFSAYATAKLVRIKTCDHISYSLVNSNGLFVGKEGIKKFFLIICIVLPHSGL